MNPELQAAISSLDSYLREMQRIRQQSPLERDFAEALIHLARGIDIVHQDVIAIRSTVEKMRSVQNQPTNPPK
jgi:hypothetical protein